MTHIQLPISKSIANRLLMLQAINGLPLMKVSNPNIPDDVRCLHDALESVMNGANGINIDNCGTAMRFLTAFCAQRDGKTIFIDGSSRMRQRPIGQLVDILRECGAHIEYWDQEGYPPLVIHGKQLETRNLKLETANLASTQFVSALLLSGIDVRTTDESPYIAMTRKIIRKWNAFERRYSERDWSSAAFWYEYIAIHGGELFLDELKPSTLQGDQVVTDIFRNFGVATYFEKGGVRIVREREIPDFTDTFRYSFRDCPDLYPAVALTCRQLHILFQPTDTERLRFKECDRIFAVEHLRTDHDHRMAMALLAADLPCDDIDCISKSYPTFYQQLCDLQPET